ncbi:dihydrolipoyl dehydrogenase [Comamonas terrigena]|uniref:Dihydrolipoyl dehydrogenase n=1 Tax=Comamonas terrigena TaxID=32013 RepID=A0A2A7UTH8_COMTR|nr:dihydrolipoyl dehydrogenase [Comamonas terrigena]PEH88496.1 dihydrolipoyl dehydrogenase [Comamonas terrigena]BBL23489.1 dihydrolipoyl dehydrogenase [Comamonas terrigena NBRC 13299]SUY87982.1 Mercuric reductase [Comamonas terrigena]
MGANVQVDVAVIGAGTAGMNAFSTLRKAGVRAVIIDQGPLGTTCARVGCMPSKAVLQAGKRWDMLRSLLPAAHRDRALDLLPAGSTTPQLLWEQALTTRDQLVEGNIRQLNDLAGDALLSGQARFTGPQTLLLEGGTTVEAKAFVLATGSEATRPQALHDALGDKLITTDELFYLDALPRSLAVVGLGPIGLEMGLALSRLGSQVVGSNRSRRIGLMEDPEVNSAALDYFGRQFPMAFEAPVTAQRRSDGRVDFQAGAVQTQVDWVLAATGRVPRTQALALEQAGAHFDDKGRLCWDAVTQQVLGVPMFLAGDVSSDRPLMHEAAVGGVIAAQRALQHLGLEKGQPVRRRSAPLSIVFSDPDLAVVGKRFNSLPPDAVVATTRGSGNGRSKIMQAPHHVLRLYADASSRKLLGASIFCAGGEHLAHQLAWAVQRGETSESLRDLPYYHPTVEEMIDNALKELRKAFKKIG